MLITEPQQIEHAPIAFDLSIPEPSAVANYRDSAPRSYIRSSRLGQLDETFEWLTA
jgi:hypothetical protein